MHMSVAQDKISREFALSRSTGSLVNQYDGLTVDCIDTDPFLGLTRIVRVTVAIRHILHQGIFEPGATIFPTERAGSEP
jgi:hypothetical protein